MPACAANLCKQDRVLCEREECGFCPAKVANYHACMSAPITKDGGQSVDTDPVPKADEAFDWLWIALIAVIGSFSTYIFFHLAWFVWTAYWVYL